MVLFKARIFLWGLSSGNFQRQGLVCTSHFRARPIIITSMYILSTIKLLLRFFDTEKKHEQNSLLTILLWEQFCIIHIYNIIPHTTYMHESGQNKKSKISNFKGFLTPEVKSCNGKTTQKFRCWICITPNNKVFSTYFKEVKTCV